MINKLYSWKTIYQLLNDRGEYYRNTGNAKSFLETNIKSISALFTDRDISFNINDAIIIGPIESNLFGEIASREESIILRFVKYIEEPFYTLDSPPHIETKRKIIDDADNNSPNNHIGLEIHNNNSSYLLTLESERALSRYSGKKVNNNLQFIGTRSLDREINGKLWDNITLSDKENYVIEALKIIEPNTERIAFIEESLRRRRAVIKLKNNDAVIPITSMGDGINRILTIILALVNAENGYLLIDEFENGLHHSIQRKLWDIIFRLSQRLNVQVFTTTHSEDSINSFQQVLNERENKTDGKLIRLDNKKGKIAEIEFDAKELEIATNQNIEIR